MESMSIYRKFKFKDSLGRNIFKRSNMNYRMAEETSEQDYMFRKFNVEDSLARNVFNRSNIMVDVT
jgi:hypothetical protein